MKKTPEQVKKLVETYLNTECIHKFPIVEITQEVVSTYDGDYPYVLLLIIMVQPLMTMMNFGMI